MSISYYIKGIIPADEKYNKMLSIHNQCKELNIESPKEVLEFFNHVNTPDPTGYGMTLDDTVVSEWNDRYYNGYEVIVDRIPEKVKILRFIVG